jgi:AraC-like DNA-binding protein
MTDIAEPPCDVRVGPLLPLADLLREPGVDATGAFADASRTKAVTLRDLLGTVRRESSNHLLGNTELPVSDVAWILGYSDPTVFARAFRHWTDASPSAWRNTHARTR